MSLILARSPFYVSKGNLADGATVLVNVGYRDGAGVLVTLANYTVVFRSESDIDISPFIRDFLGKYPVLEIATNLNGSNGQGVPQPQVTENHIAVEGFGYYEEGANKDFTDYLSNNVAYYAGSNQVVYRNRTEPVRIPLLNPSAPSSTPTIVTSYEKGVVQSTENIDFGFSNVGGFDFYETEKRIDYIEVEEAPTSFEERVLDDGGVFESGNCYNQYDDLYCSSTIDEIVITPDGDTSLNYTVKIVPVVECKYIPYRLTFLNKLGVKEDLWFFKKSTNEMSTQRESYKANTVSDYIAGDLTQHSYSSYNLNGRETLSMNTGFIPESFKENIKQLGLSEFVWIEKDGQTLPVTVKNAQLLLKQSVNEKLINYEIEVEFAYDIINNIG